MVLCTKEYSQFVGGVFLCLKSGTNLQILVNLPQSLLLEIDGFLKQENVNRDELIYQATKMFLRERKKTHSQICQTGIRGNSQELICPLHLKHSKQSMRQNIQ